MSIKLEQIITSKTPSRNFKRELPYHVKTANNIRGYFTYE